MKLKGLRKTELIPKLSFLAVKEDHNNNASIPTNEVVSKYNHVAGLNFPKFPNAKGKFSLVPMFGRLMLSMSLCKVNQTS